MSIVCTVHTFLLLHGIRLHIQQASASEAPSNRLSFVLSARLNRVVRVHILRFYTTIVDIVIISCGCTPQDIIFTGEKKGINFIPMRIREHPIYMCHHHHRCRRA